MALWHLKHAPLSNAKKAQHSLLDLICRKEVVYGDSLSMEPVIARVAAYLDCEHVVGQDKTRLVLASTLLRLSRKHYALVTKNPWYFRALVLRRPTKDKLSKLRELLELHATALHCLDVSFCHEYITDDVLESLVKPCVHLRQCILWGCHQLTDHGLIALATHCRYLTFLNFGGCPRITDAAIEIIGHELLYLDNLHMSGCKKVTDAGVAALAAYSRVVLQLTPPTTEPFRTPLEFDLHHMMTQLRMFDCKKVGYREVAPGCHELVLWFGSRPKAVSLWCTLDAKGRQSKYVPKLTSFDQSVAYAGWYQCISLKVLNVTGCALVTDVSLRRVRDVHVQLRVLR
ncbi:hypothetical protein ACHHYP_05076 [Achlya hypogyna]|uniref:F-box/LRR-repeat protein 15-like leucin rich repeat domain-containing protein n=1 Tax=Achlya hypogyna TaxID=1202772 RepID=A0A1V9YZM8_ACHHY|nr:hypothetical protein ACHHYP_05076 [Achlya hypogyna]